MTYGELLREGAAALEAAGIDEAHEKAEILLIGLKKWSKTDYILKNGQTVDETEKELYVGFLTLVKGHVPVQHILHEAPFFGRNFYVDENVLIPRFDTEVLVLEALKRIREADIEKCGGSPERRESLRILDLCTGSGCIAVTLSKELESKGIPAAIFASDISPEALRIAERNAELLGASVTFVKSDLFSEISGKFDVVVSNPPYISDAEIETLSAEVRDHDPRLALSGGPDGLSFYRRIASVLLDFLLPGGRIFFEIGEEQGEDVKNILEQNGFSELRILRDLAGLDRVITARMKGSGCLTD